MGDQSGIFTMMAETETVDEDAGRLVRSRFFAPPPDFDGCFTTFYQLELDCAEDDPFVDYLQPEWTNMRFFAGSAPEAEIDGSLVIGAPFTATGPSSRPCRFKLGSTRMWGIGLLPLGLARFLDAEAADLTNGVYDGASHPVFEKFDCLTSVLCDASLSNDEQLEFLQENMLRLMRPNRDEPKIRRVHAALVSGDYVAVGDLADACGMSIRTLERVCHRYFGFTPKLLMRRQRFMRSLSSFMLLRGSRWTEVMDAEYHDQAQFTREFTEFMTMRPSEYASLDHPILSAFMEARARIYGTAAQTLDKPSR